MKRKVTNSVIKNFLLLLLRTRVNLYRQSIKRRYRTRFGSTTILGRSRHAEHFSVLKEGPRKVVVGGERNLLLKWINLNVCIFDVVDLSQGS